MLKLLFIGNSHTFFNDLPAMVGELFERVLDKETHVTMLTYPGCELRWHADQPQTKFNILHGGYDYVILQQATHPFDGKDCLIRQAEPLCDWIRAAKATPVAYMTWAKKDTPADQTELTEAFAALAEKENMILAPAGEVWKALWEQYPEKNLYWQDGQHANPLGSAVAAAAIFSAITGGKLPEADDLFWAEKGGDERLVSIVKNMLEN